MKEEEEGRAAEEKEEREKYDSAAQYWGRWESADEGWLSWPWIGCYVW